MPRLADQLEKLPDLLAERAARYRVPGASCAVLRDGETFECATGVVNLETGVEATTDAVFQIGSITKLFTTSLVMQLVDEGRVELDAPVRCYLPELQLGSVEAAREITVRQLLTHTSGIDGDFFQDTGRGDDCVERYVLACSGLGQLHPPGRGFSYCNAGFVIAGRIVEVLRGASFDAVLRERLAERIGARSLESLPERSLYYRTALGHVPDGSGAFRVAPTPFLAHSNGPAGSTAFAASRDLLQLAKLHLAGGTAGEGARVLSAASVDAMQTPQVDVPRGAGAQRFGLGWMLFDWGGQRVIGHDGATVGQNAYLRIVPERNVAAVLLTNGGNTAALYRHVFDAVLGPLAGVTLPPLPEPSAVVLDPERYAGTYERLAVRLRIEAREGGLWMKTTERRSLFPVPEAPEVQLHPVDEQLFAWSAPGSRFRNLLCFATPDPTGRPPGLHAATRYLPRIA